MALTINHPMVGVSIVGATETSPTDSLTLTQDKEPHSHSTSLYNDLNHKYSIVSVQFIDSIYDGPDLNLQDFCLIRELILYVLIL